MCFVAVLLYSCVQGPDERRKIFIAFNGLLRSTLEYCASLVFGQSKLNACKSEKNVIPVFINFHAGMAIKTVKHKFKSTEERGNEAVLRLVNKARNSLTHKQILEGKSHHTESFHLCEMLQKLLSKESFSPQKTAKFTLCFETIK